MNGAGGGGSYLWARGLSVLMAFLKSSVSVLATQEHGCLPVGSHWQSLLSGW